MSEDKNKIIKKKEKKKEREAYIKIGKIISKQRSLKFYIGSSMKRGTASANKGRCSLIIEWRGARNGFQEVSFYKTLQYRFVVANDYKIPRRRMRINNKIKKSQYFTI